MKNSIAAVLNSEDHYFACLENENDIHFSLFLVSPSVYFQTSWYILLNLKQKGIFCYIGVIWANATALTLSLPSENICKTVE